MPPNERSDELLTIIKRLDKLDAIDEIHRDVRALLNKELPAVNVHLAQLNGSVARNTAAIGDLNAWRDKAPCTTHATQLAVLQERDANQDEKHGQQKKNWALVLQVVIGILQAVGIAMIISEVIP